MVTRRIRSEYTKKFKDPKWDTYAQCYEDLVKYRLSRRLLEQAHNPWFWGECGSDTESSGKSTPRVQNEAIHEKPEPALTEHAQETTAPDIIEENASTEVKEPDTSLIQDVREDIKPQEKEKDKRREALPAATVVQQKPHPFIQNKSKIKRRHLQKSVQSKAKHHPTKDTEQESRHPFALYGSGDKQADMASKRTHNVGPAASTKEIHESALRAKTRRELEKKMRRLDKHRVKSADLEKRSKTEIVTDYNPWMTEYMRCFSARSR